MYIFLAEAAATGTQFPIYFVAVYFVGFLAALVLGTIAWNVTKNQASRDNPTSPKKTE